MQITKHIIIFAAAAVLLSSPGLVQSQQVPETIDEAKGFGLQFLQELPEAMQRVWENEAVPVFSGMWEWAKDNIFSWARDLWENVLRFFGQEVEKRRPDIEQEFQKEKQQLKEELEQQIPGEGKTLWELLKGFFEKDEE